MADSGLASAPVDTHSSAATSEPSASTSAPSTAEQATATAQSTLASIQTCKRLQSPIHNEPRPHTLCTAASSAMSSIQNHPTVQSVTSGPVAQNVQQEANKTGNEFQALANSRTAPEQSAATGQSLTHYHSLFYNLLSWENPRATAITYFSVVAFIFLARYLNIISYLFKLTAYTLAVTATLEITGKALFDHGLSTRMRPRKYYTIPRESLERMLGDVEQLINFFVIEAQRILFAENVFVTVAAFLAAAISYGLIKIVPFWGLTLIGVTALFGFPLIYATNKEAIDGLLDHAGTVANNQATEFRKITAEHTGQATESIKKYTSEYTSMAQSYLGGARKASSPHATHEPVKSAEFPTVPKTDEVYPSVPKTELSAATDASATATHNPLHAQ